MLVGFIVITTVAVAVFSGVFAYQYFAVKIQPVIQPQQNQNTVCTPNWQCTWGTCVNGYQSQVPVDSNNCGLSSSTANIACTALARQCVSATETCTDSDGGKNYNVKGSLSGICTGGGDCGAWIDKCQDSNNLVEYFCDGTNYNTNFEIYRCPNGCENGACK